MGVVWIIQNPTGERSSLARVLQGDFAVRLFASLKSFENLAKVKDGGKPDIVIIDELSIGVDYVKSEKVLQRALPDTARMYVNTDQAKIRIVKIISANREDFLPTFFIEEDDDFSLSQKIREIMTGEVINCKISHNLVAHQNIILDFDKLTLQVLPNDTQQTLTLTEARILKLMLANWGMCLSRERIKKEVWNDAQVTIRTIDTHISRLRKHLTYAESQIESVYGGGYIFK